MIDTDSPIVLVAICFGLLVAIGLAIAVRRVLDRSADLAKEKEREPWNLAVAAIAAELGLEYEPLETAPHRARGDVCGASVQIGYESARRDAGVWMSITVFVTNAPETLSWRPRGDAERAGSATGDPEIDARLDVQGAPEALARAMRDDPAFRARLLMAASEGMRMKSREIVLAREQFASTPGELHDLVATMVELGQHIEHPTPFTRDRGLGTPVAVAIRRAKRLDDDARRDALTSVLRSLPLDLVVITDLEPGAPCAARVRLGDRDVRIAVSSSLGLELTCPQERRRLVVTFDPDEKQTPHADVSLVQEDLFIASYGMTIPVDRAQYDALDPTLRTAIETDVPRLGIRYFWWLEHELKVTFWPSLDRIPDPEATLRDALALVQRAVST